MTVTDLIDGQRKASVLPAAESLRMVRLVRSIRKVFPQAANSAPAVIDYREINALQKDPQRARDLAMFLFKLKDIEWTEWELDFLENISGWTEDLTTRQGEKLVELRDASTWYETVEGLSLRLLVEKCYCARLDLSEFDAEFFERIKASGSRKFRRRDAARILHRARQLGEIESYQGHTLSPPIPRAA